MHCLICQKEIPTKLGYISHCYRYCQACFTHIIEKRIRKYVREHSPLKKGQRIVVKDPLRRYVAEQVLHIPLTQVKKKTKDAREVLMDTSDDIVISFLKHLFFGEKIEKKTKNEMRLFSTITDEELALYCQYSNLPFHPKKNVLKEYLKKLEEKHPEIMHGLYKSAEDLKEVF